MKQAFPFFFLAFVSACSSGPERPDRITKKNAADSGSDVRPDGSTPTDRTTPSPTDGDGAPNTPPNNSTPLAPDKVLKKLSITEPKLLQDGLDYTLASLELSAEGKAPFSLAAHYLYDEKLSEMSKAHVAAISELCGAIDMSGASNRLTVRWRSHYSTAKKAAVAEAITAGHKSIACLLEVKDALGATSFLQFDPLPASESGFLGAAKIAAAIDAGLMLLVANPLIDPSSTKILKLSPTKLNFSSVKSLGSTELKAEVSKEAGTACQISTANAMTVSNPTNAKTFAISTKEGKISAFQPVAVAGKILKACAKAKLTVNDGQANLGFTCADYHETKNEGLEAGCQWTLTVENKLDSEDSATVTVAMPKLVYATASPKDWKSGKDTVPQSNRNPVRLKNVTFKGFGTNELVFMEKVFDILLDTTPEIFDLDFNNYIKTVVLNTTGPCTTPGVAGFARLNSTEVSICPSIMRPGLDVPYNVVLVAHTLVHEVRHARGLSHDFDKPNYEPCKGTAYSLLMDHNILSTCKSSYCPLLKSAAESSYMSDINYSLRNDERRFQGLCKMWQNDIGFTDARIRNGR